MSERYYVNVSEEVSPVIHNFSDKEISDHLNDYDFCRNVFSALILTGIGLVAGADKLPQTNLMYAEGAMLISGGYWAMESLREDARMAITEARSRGLKVVKNLFSRKLDLQDRTA